MQRQFFLDQICNKKGQNMARILTWVLNKYPVWWFTNEAIWKPQSPPKTCMNMYRIMDQ